MRDVEGLARPGGDDLEAQHAAPSAVLEDDHLAQVPRAVGVASPPHGQGERQGLERVG